MTEKPLSGCRILVVEDDYYQAQDSRELLQLAGAHIVTIGATVPDIRPLLAGGGIDVGLIDINLGQGSSFEFARVLRDHAIPIVFLTGYDESILPDDLADTPYIIKPANSHRIIEQLFQVMNAQPIPRSPAD